jgi:hypothetical protein
MRAHKSRVLSICWRAGAEQARADASASVRALPLARRAPLLRVSLDVRRRAHAHELPPLLPVAFAGYSIYLRYQYRSTNADAEGAARRQGRVLLFDTVCDNCQHVHGRRKQGAKEKKYANLLFKGMCCMRA